MIIFVKKKLMIQGKELTEKKEVVRFSSKELSRQKTGEALSLESAKAVKKSNKKVANDNSKYIVKVVDGVTHMILRNKL